MTKAQAAIWYTLAALLARGRYHGVLRMRRPALDWVLAECGVAMRPTATLPGEIDVALDTIGGRIRLLAHGDPEPLGGVSLGWAELARATTYHPHAGLDHPDRLSTWVALPLAQVLLDLGRLRRPVCPHPDYLRDLAEALRRWRPGALGCIRAAWPYGHLCLVGRESGGRRALRYLPERIASARDAVYRPDRAVWDSAPTCTLTDYIRYAHPTIDLAADEDRDYLLSDWLADHDPHFA